MASSQSFSSTVCEENPNKPRNHHDNPIEITIPEDRQEDIVGAVHNVYVLTREIRAGPPIFEGCPPLSEDEIFQALVIVRNTREKAALLMAELVGISTIVQNVLYQTKFKKHICVHSPKIREKFEILNRTLKKVAKGVFDYIFGDLSAVKPINLELLANGATVQYKQVKAVAESARAITKELACDKLNSVIRENAIAGYVF